MNEHEVHRDLGRHDAEIVALQEEVRALRRDIAAVKELLEQARGGWKVLMLMGGAGAAMGAFASKIVALLFQMPIR